MEENRSNLPEFNYGPDDVLAKISLICFFAPIMYGLFFGYLPPFLHIPMIPGFIAVIAGLYFLGRFLTKLVAEERIPHDPEKTMRDYVDLKKSWLAFLGSIAIAVAFFFIALAVKNWFWAEFDDGTEAHSRGYVYELLCAVYAFFVTLYSSITWFFHDGTFMPTENYLTFGIAAPFTVWFIMPMFAGLPKNVAAYYAVVLLVLFFIRHLRIRSYKKMIEKIEKNQKYSSYHSKYDE